jgi:VanZ family protein
MTTLKWWAEAPRIYFLSIAWAGVILTLSALPGRDLPEVDIIHIDKLAHVIVYAILSLFLGFSFKELSWKKVVLGAFIFTVSYGMAMELMQDRFFEERFFDWYDALANSLGAIVGIVIFRKIV